MRNPYLKGMLWGSEMMYVTWGTVDVIIFSVGRASPKSLGAGGT